MPNRPRRKHAYVGWIRIIYTLERFIGTDSWHSERMGAPVASTSYARIQSIAEKHANETCTHAYELQGDTGMRRCLLGWMATDSGVRLPNETYNTHVLGMKGTGRFVREMQSEYGLSLDQLKQLQSANDESKSPAHLKELVSRLIETWSSGPEPAGESATEYMTDQSAQTVTHGETQIAPRG